MKYVDEFRDPDAAKALLTRIHDDAEKLGRSISLMEVCGGHTHTIYRYGLETYCPAPLNWCTAPAAQYACCPWAGLTTPCGSPNSPTSFSPASAT